MERCPNCQGILEERDTNFCTKCGFRLRDVDLSSLTTNPNNPPLNNNNIRASMLQFSCPVCNTPYSLQRKIPNCQVCNLKFLYDINGNPAPSIDIYYRTLGPSYMENIIRNYDLGKNGIPYDDINANLKGSNDERYQAYRYGLLNSGRRKLGVGSGILLPLLSTIIIAIFVAISLIFTGININTSVISISIVFTLFYLIIPMFYIKRFVGYKIPFKARLNLIGIPIGFYDAKDWVKNIILGLAIGSLMLVVVVLSQFFADWLFKVIYGFSFSDVEELVSEMPGLDFGMDISLITVILFALGNIFIIGPSEEAMFRAYSQTGFENSLGKIGGTIFGASYFAMFHILLNIILEPVLFIPSFVPYMAISLILSFTYTKKKNIIAVWVAHAYYNSMLLIIPYILMHTI